MVPSVSLNLQVPYVLTPAMPLGTWVTVVQSSDWSLKQWRTVWDRNNQHRGRSEGHVELAVGVFHDAGIAQISAWPGITVSYSRVKFHASLDV